MNKAATDRVPCTENRGCGGKDNQNAFKCIPCRSPRRYIRITVLRAGDRDCDRPVRCLGCRIIIWVGSDAPPTWVCSAHTSAADGDAVAAAEGRPERVSSRLAVTCNWSLDISEGTKRFALENFAPSLLARCEKERQDSRHKLWNSPRPHVSAMVSAYLVTRVSPAMAAQSAHPPQGTAAHLSPVHVHVCDVRGDSRRDSR